MDLPKKTDFHKQKQKSSRHTVQGSVIKYYKCKCLCVVQQPAAANNSLSAEKEKQTKRVPKSVL